MHQRKHVTEYFDERIRYNSFVLFYSIGGSVTSCGIVLNVFNKRSEFPEAILFVWGERELKIKS